jgi:hypothetical protein
MKRYQRVGSLLELDCRYLANDMQFYVIAPLLLLPLVYRPRLGLALTFFAILSIAMIDFGLAYQQEVSRFIEDDDD